MITRVKMIDFAKKVFELLKSDRDVLIGVAGFTGEGKSTFTTQLAKTYAEKVANTYWGFDRMTWVRDEMMDWIDGKGKSKEGQLPEYSVVIPDELFSMFYSRQWYESEQIDAITVFNMCRDRHLLIVGNVPNFWSLDKGFTDRVRFYVYVPYRGVAWVFEQENNPFTRDGWNVAENMKKFRILKNPEKCPNFICEIVFNDWTAEEKEEYYNIRNTKRVEALETNKEKRKEKFSRIKVQRNELINWLLSNPVKLNNKKVSSKKVSEVVGLSESQISAILNNSL